MHVGCSNLLHRCVMSNLMEAMDSWQWVSGSVRAKGISMAANSILVIVHVDEAFFGEWVVFLLAKPCIHLPMQSDMAALIWCTIPQVCYCLFVLRSCQTSENTFERNMCWRPSYCSQFTHGSWKTASGIICGCFGEEIFVMGLPFFCLLCIFVMSGF